MTAETSVETTASATEQQPTGEATPETKQPETQSVGGAEDGNKDGMKEAPAWLQKRFNQVISQKNNLKSEVETLRSELEQLKKATQQPEKPLDKAQFSTEAEYIHAIAAQKVQEILQQQQSAALQAQAMNEQSQTLQQSWAKQVSEVADFAQSIEAAEGAGVQIPADIKSAVENSPDRPKIAYYLSKNPAEAERLFLVPKAQMEREVIRLELKSDAYWEGAKSAVAAQVTKPQTMPKTNGKPANAAPSIENLSGDEYLREFRRQQAERAKAQR